MVNFLDGVLPSWLAAVPPGDLAAVRPHVRLNPHHVDQDLDVNLRPHF